MDVSMHGVLVGPAGAGKGTLAGFLKNLYPGIEHVCSGDLLREEVRNNTLIGRQIKQTVKEGGHVSDEIVEGLVFGRLEQVIAERKRFLLDGFPQSEKEDQALRKFLEERGQKALVIILKVDDQVALERMSHRFSCPDCKRVYNSETNLPKNAWECDDCKVALEQRPSDMDVEKARKRLQHFRDATQKVVDIYAQSQGSSVVIFNGNLPFEDCMRQYQQYFTG